MCVVRAADKPCASSVDQHEADIHKHRHRRIQRRAYVATHVASMRCNLLIVSVLASLLFHVHPLVSFCRTDQGVRLFQRHPLECSGLVFNAMSPAFALGNRHHHYQTRTKATTLSNQLLWKQYAVAYARHWTGCSGSHFDADFGMQSMFHFAHIFSSTRI